MMRRLNWISALALVGFGTVALGGCAAEAQIGGKLETPPPTAPVVDSDGDGIPEPPDKCPDAKEDGQPPDPQDGCPTTDADGDGIPIPQDKCPDEPETKNGFEDEDGCPDKKPIAQVVGTKVQINEKILFAKGSAKITDDSMRVVDAVAEVLKKNPGIQLTEVAGHASAEGDEWYNRALTQKRVNSVVAALVERGVARERLLAQGYGFYCPLAEGDDEASHEKNRRVEFNILHLKGKVTENATNRGCDQSKKKGIKPKALPDVKPFEEDTSPKSKGTPKADTTKPANKPAK